MTRDEQRIIARAARSAAPVFAANGWTWGGQLKTEPDPFVPTEADLAIELARMVAQVVASHDPEDPEAHKTAWLMCGRFRVVAELNEESERLEGVSLWLEIGQIYDERGGE